ncbi:Fpg/Nei family DNA glycosylase [Knoellia aerolata]|uniref:DNA-(apurinic or apyrimidinic site) lyase n=1 Tax=Knoellia aerolata DSM 18566 TaxID=1385519 RepID=A0A0A0JVJ4_9MICO|nr:DNA-formamidopyrimidine glycosylase family protein [Knoellia aerolata]KGN41430.1 DNA glycosylase [Knoellia aerolata DSM 18566]
MPEGHTLFALARDLDTAFRGTSPEVSSPQGKFAGGAALLSGHEVVEATSWGKHLFVEFAGDRVLWVHLGLIGTFTIDTTSYAGELPVVGQVRCRFATDDHVADLRGPMVCDVVTPEKVDEVLARLGPDPLRPADPRSDPDLAWARIQRSSKPIAELLMDQAVLAGVGNVYRSEVLFRLRVHPFRPGNKLQRRTWRAIWADLVALLPLGVATSKIVTVHEQVDEVARALEAGEEVRLTSRDSYVYKRQGEACHVCGSRIRTQVVAGRNLFWCGNCQRRG